MLLNAFSRRVFLWLGWLLISTSSLAATSTTYKVATEADDVVTRVLFDSIAHHFNLEIEYVNYPSFNDILVAIETGNADFAANITYTDLRAQRFDFQDQPTSSTPISTVMVAYVYPSCASWVSRKEPPTGPY